MRYSRRDEAIGDTIKKAADTVSKKVDKAQKIKAKQQKIKELQNQIKDVEAEIAKIKREEGVYRPVRYTLPDSVVLPGAGIMLEEGDTIEVL
jgi:predicted RNase H-like nuclease (RuvC/YqgF family)